jgi:hypothetical protein
MPFLVFFFFFPFFLLFLLRVDLFDRASSFPSISSSSSPSVLLGDSCLHLIFNSSFLSSLHLFSLLFLAVSPLSSFVLSSFLSPLLLLHLADAAIWELSKEALRHGVGFGCRCSKGRHGGVWRSRRRAKTASWVQSEVWARGSEHGQGAATVREMRGRGSKLGSGGELGLWVASID